MSEENKRPERTFRAGCVSASVWRNEVEHEGRTILRWSTRIRKTYRDETRGDWRSTEYFQPAQLSDLLIVTRHALDYIRLRDGGGDDAKIAAAEEQQVVA